MTEKSLAITSEVRSWFVGHPKTFARLSPSAQRTVVRDGLRGRLSPEAIDLFNKSQRKSEYVLGATKVTARAQAKAAARLRARAAKAGHVGARGPLPKAFLATVK